jgi:very-short-patch-repair endonuclease
MSLVQDIKIILSQSDIPLSINDIRLRLPSPRPGLLELESVILRNSEQFVFAPDLRVSLVSAESTVPDAGFPFKLPSPADILAYYEDCTRQDRSRLRVYSSHLGAAAVETSTEWSGGGPGLRVLPKAVTSQSLVVSALNPATAHVYGYPIAAQWNDTSDPQPAGMKFSPVFIWHLERTAGTAQTGFNRLSFTINPNDFYLNPDVLWHLPARQRKVIADLFQKEKSLEACLEWVQAGYLGIEVQESLLRSHLRSKPPLHSLRAQDEGIYNRGMYLASIPNSYTKGLLSELAVLRREFSERLPTNALGQFLGLPEPDARQAPVKMISPVTRPLNAFQETAITRALNHPLSVVTGPPGTGKSEVVVALIVNAVLNNRSVLFASRNNGAIEVVQNRVENALDKNFKLLRLGSDFDKETKDRIHQLLQKPPTEKVQSITKECEAFDRDWRKLSEVLATISVIHEQLNKADLAEANFRRLIELIAPQVPELHSMKPSEVEADKLGFEDLVERLQKQQWLAAVPIFAKRLHSKACAKVVREFSGSIDNLKRLGLLQPEAFSRQIQEDLSGWSRAVLQLLELLDSAHEASASAARLKLLGTMESHYQAVTAIRTALTQGILAKVQATLIDRYSTVSATKEFRQGAAQSLNLIGTAFEEKLYQEHPLSQVLKVLPMWAVSNLSACGRLPLCAGLFDLVVIDEASQCDIPSCLPLLFRAKQAVVIGDPMQLSPITNLPPQAEKNLLLKNRFPHPGCYRYSDNSAYELAFALAPASGKTFLAEHYRCHPEIIGFVNGEHWYQNRLEALTNVKILKKSRFFKLGISWIEVDGEPRNAVSGYWIPAEAERITEEIKRLIIDEGFQGTVGVVTPFRRMANAITEAVENAQIARNRLDECAFRADTAHRFQGDERDIVFYAPCFHPQMPKQHKWFLASQKNVFNVAISRARSAFVVVGSRSALATAGIDYLEEFVRYCSAIEAASPKQSNDGIQRGYWEPIFEEKLLQAGLPVKAQYPVGPYWLDFALIQGSRSLDIEVDGEQFHKDDSGLRSQRDIDRDIYLQANGWKVMRFWVYQLRDDMNDCVERVRKWWIEKN